VAKASSLRPRPSLLYLEAQMTSRNVSWVDKEATHSFMSMWEHANTKRSGLAGLSAKSGYFRVI
jgi:hypothetical protein